MRLNSSLRAALAATYHRIGDTRTATAYAVTSLVAALSFLAGVQ